MKLRHFSEALCIDSLWSKYKIDRLVTLAMAVAAAAEERLGASGMESVREQLIMAWHYNVRHFKRPDIRMQSRLQT